MTESFGALSYSREVMFSCFFSLRTFIPAVLFSRTLLHKTSRIVGVRYSFFSAFALPSCSADVFLMIFEKYVCFESAFSCMSCVAKSTSVHGQLVKRVAPMQMFVYTLSGNTITLDVNDSTHERFKSGQVQLSEVDVCVVSVLMVQ